MSNFADLFDRAKVRCYFDNIKQELVFVSFNKDEPLTDKEMKEITSLCAGIGIYACRFEENEKRR